MVILDLLTRVNSIRGLLRIILIPINDQLRLQGKIKERELTKEETSNRLHHHQVILGVIQTQTLVTMMTMTMKEETMAGAERSDAQNATLEGHRFLETHPPYKRHSISKKKRLHPDAPRAPGASGGPGAYNVNSRPGCAVYWGVLVNRGPCHPEAPDTTKDSEGTGCRNVLQTQPARIVE